MVMTEELAEIARDLGANVNDRRKTLALSQERLARKIEMSRETVRAAESGKHLPEWPTLQKIAAALETTVRDLLGDKRVLLHASAYAA